MADRLRGKVCIITGATSGIGKAAAVLFAAEGAQVVFVGRRRERGQQLEAEIRAAGGEATFVQADVSRVEDLRRIVTTTIDTYGRVDVLYNNAAVSERFPLEACADNLESFQNMFDTNIRSTMVLSSLVIPDMKKRGSGSIINTSSPGSVMAVPGQGAYAATKGAVNAFTKTLAIELAKTGIRVNAVIPGLTDTEMVDPVEVETMFLATVPLGRMATGLDVARGALFFASDDSLYCTGSILPVDGGATSA
jgi:NAD(P)-dependent dehydrogenase (short-subunit alcohol dehydrogenase family)